MDHHAISLNVSLAKAGLSFVQLQIVIDGSVEDTASTHLNFIVRSLHQHLPPVEQEERSA